MTTKILSIILTVLFCWVIWPYKWARLAQHRTRLANAKRKADLLDSQHNKIAYVVQFGRKFKVGIREDFRRQDSKVRRELAKSMKGFLKWDYRNGIVYRTREKTS